MAARDLLAQVTVDVAGLVADEQTYIAWTTLASGPAAASRENAVRCQDGAGKRGFRTRKPLFPALS